MNTILALIANWMTPRKSAEIDLKMVKQWARECAIETDEQALHQLAQFAERAAAHTRESCAQSCDEVEKRWWKEYRYSTEPSTRFKPHTEGLSDGAGECARVIRAATQPTG